MRRDKSADDVSVQYTNSYSYNEMTYLKSHNAGCYRLEKEHRMNFLFVMWQLNPLGMN